MKSAVIDPDFSPGTPNKHLEFCRSLILQDFGESQFSAEGLKILVGYVNGHM